MYYILKTKKLYYDINSVANNKELVMKKRAFIALLSTSLLLAGCGPESIDLEKPDFIEEGTKISYADFSAQLEDVKSKNDLYNDALLSSKYFEGYYAYDTTNTIDLDGERLSTINQGGDIKATIKYDASKYTWEVKNTSKIVQSVDNQTTVSSQVANTKTHTKSGLTKDEEQYVFVETNEEEKEAYKTMTFANQEEGIGHVNGQVKLIFTYDGFSTFFDNLPEVVEGEEPDTTGYDFYRNGNTFTFSHLKQVLKEERKDAEENVYAYYSYVTYIKGQIYFSGVDATLKFYYTSEEETEYTKDFESIAFKGEKDKKTQKLCFDISIREKKVSVKAIDLSKYQTD